MDGPYPLFDIGTLKRKRDYHTSKEDQENVDKKEICVNLASGSLYKKKCLHHSNRQNSSIVT